MKHRKIIIAGVGYHANSGAQNDANVFISNDIKVNIGAAIARKSVEIGYDVILLSKTEVKLERIKRDLESLYPSSPSHIEFYALDLLKHLEVENFSKTLEPHCEYDYIHSAGLSSGNYTVLNPYLEVENTPEDLPQLEFEAVTKSLLLITKALLPIWRGQERAKVIVVNSMSAIRAYPLGFSHSSAKAGLHNAVKSLTLELTKERIFFTEINPGMVDTGGYDSDEVQLSIKKICRSFGYEYEQLPLMPPESVAEVALLCLESKAHILNINLVSEGQIPYNGS